MYCDKRQRKKAGLCCNTTQPAQDTALGVRLGARGVQAGAGRGRWSTAGGAGARQARKEFAGGRVRRRRQRARGAQATAGARGATSGARGAAAGARQQAQSTLGTGPGPAACAHRLGQLGQLVAGAPGLVFRPGFRLGIVSESPFRPRS